MVDETTNISTAHSATVAGSITELTEMGRGTDRDDRTGDNIICKGIHLRGIIYPQSGGAAATKIRVYLIRNQLPAGTALTATNVKNIIGSCSSTSVKAWVDRDTMQQYRDICSIVWRKEVHLPKYNNALDQKPTNMYHHWKKYIRFHKLIHYNADNVANAFGGLWLYIDSNTATSGDEPQIKWISRVYYENCA